MPGTSQSEKPEEPKQPGAPPIHVKIDQRTEFVAPGGKVVGVEAPNAQTVIVEAGLARTALHAKVIFAYLERASCERDAPKAEWDKLWKLPFRVHASGESLKNTADGGKIGSAVAQIFGWPPPAVGEQSGWATQPVMHKAGDQRIAVLLAEAGSGKSGALAQVMRTLAAENKERLRERLEVKPSSKRKDIIVPLLIKLPDLETGRAFESLICDAFNTQLAGSSKSETPDCGPSTEAPITVEHIQGLLHDYTCLFLLDDLDRLLHSGSSAGLQELNHFLAGLGSTHFFLISCLASAYREEFGSQTLYLDNLTEDDVRAVFDRDGTYEHLSRSIGSLARNRGIVESLLLLDRSKRLVNSKGQVLARYAEKRLTRTSPTDSDLSVEMRQELLQRIAYAMQCDHVMGLTEQQVMRFTVDYLTEWRQPHAWPAVRRQLQDSDQVKFDTDTRRWKFVDDRTQAYYAAAALCEDPAKLHHALETPNDRWWKEVLGIAVGLVPDPIGLFFELIDRDPIVAAACLPAAGATIDTRTMLAVIDAGLQQMRRESSGRRRMIVELISESGHERVPESLLLAMHQEWSSSVTLAIFKALRRWVEEEAQRVARRRGQGSVECEDRSAVLNALASIEMKALAVWIPETRPVVPMLRLCYEHLWSLVGDSDSQSDPLIQKILAMATSSQPLDNLEPVVQRATRRWRGLAALTLGLSATPQAHQTLCELFADEHADDFVAWCGLDALIDRWPTSPSESPGDTASPQRRPLDQILQQARQHITGDRFKAPKDDTEDKWQRHRARAIYLLVSVPQKQSPKALIEHALRDRAPLVRSAAVDALAKRNLPGAETRLQKILTSETDFLVLRKAAEALSRIGTNQSLPYLERHLRHERTTTRRAMQQAVEILRDRYS